MHRQNCRSPVLHPETDNESPVCDFLIFVRVNKMSYSEQIVASIPVDTSLFSFIPLCMECQCGLATRKLSVRPSVRPFVSLSVRQTRDL